MKLGRLNVFVGIVMFFVSVYAQTPIQPADLSKPTKIAPEYFGPNAFPVPDMLDGATSSDWSVELYSDNYFSNIPSLETEFTSSIFMRLRIPLFTPRANFVVYGNVFEYFRTPKSVNQFRRVKYDGDVLQKSLVGDIYVSTDIMLLTQQKNYIDLALRAALKSASGGMYEYARYYDGPGYFFDATFGRTINFAYDDMSVKFALSGGFLCWQTDNGRQNDAVMYGAKTVFNVKKFTLSAEYSGYVGWENLGDAPMVLRIDAAYKFSNLAINCGYQAGLMDYPFHRTRLGLTYYFNL